MNHIHHYVLVQHKGEEIEEVLQETQVTICLEDHSSRRWKGKPDTSQIKYNLVCRKSFDHFWSIFFLLTIVLSAFLSTTPKNSFQNRNTPLTSLLIWWNVHIFYITSLITLGQKQWIERHQVSAASCGTKALIHKAFTGKDKRIGAAFFRYTKWDLGYSKEKQDLQINICENKIRLWHEGYESSNI